MKCGVPFFLLYIGFGLDQFSRTNQLALLRKPNNRALIKAAVEDTKALTTEEDKHDIEIVRHQKAPGEGYVIGSPLFIKQEGLDGAGRQEEASGNQEEASKGDELPISTTVKCLLNLLIQYFILYTALAILRTYNGIVSPGSRALNAQQIVKNATDSVNYAPMLCVLFLGTRMRAIQLTQGDTEKYHLPQPWVQNAMQVASWAVLAKAIISLLMGITGHEEQTADSDKQPIKDAKSSQPQGGIGIVFEVAQYVAMAGLYGGFIAVVAGVIIMKAPREIWGDEPPPVSPAVNNVINLCAQYFIVILIYEIYSTMERNNKGSATKSVEVWKLAKETVLLAPMLCVMFLAVRQRALQMDPKNGNPQAWAQNCMFLCSYSVLVQTVLVLIVSYSLGECKRDKNAVEGDVTFVVKNETLNSILSLVRLVLMVVLYVGFIVIAISPFLLTMKGKPTPPISPALCNVLLLVMQYFFVYLCLWLSIMYRQNSGGEGGNLAVSIFNGAKFTVMFCPMLAILFVAARMRSGQIGLLGGVESAPQRYAQEAMHLATWSLFVQLLMVIFVGILQGKVEVDAETGEPISSGSGVGHKIIECIRYVCLLSLYGGIVAVLYGIFTMDVETVNVANRQPGLIPGVKIPALGDVAQQDLSKLNPAMF